MHHYFTRQGGASLRKNAFMVMYRRSMELAVDHRDDQKNEHRDDSDRYDPIRSHPTQSRQYLAGPTSVRGNRGSQYLRAIPRRVFTLLST